MKIELKNLHTIVMFVGVSGSAKSTKARQINELAQNKGLRSVILSSDDCRQELLLGKYHHHAIEMSQISDKAFDLLLHKAELYLEWPYNVNLLILDMMNLQTEARQKIIDLSNKHCYDIIAIVMDYQNIDEYFIGLDKKYNRRVISRQLHKFHRETLPELGRRLYNDLLRIKSKAEPIELECRFHIGLMDTSLPEDKHYFIVGDIHECLESFKALIKKAGFNIEKVMEINGKEIEKITGNEDTIIITVGDILDKGNKTKETIEFMYNNMDRIYSVFGGHEGFVRKWLKADVKWTDDIEFYTSIPILEKDEELRKKFFAILEHMKPFYNAKYFTITHAGCESKFIGKTQKYAIKAQRYYHVERFDKSADDEIWLSYRRESLKYLKEEAEVCHPFHIFGHESWKNCLIYKNKINLDTGCVSGGRLTGIKINKYGRYKLYHVDCVDEVVLINEKLREFTFEEPKIELEELEERDYKRLANYAKNKINFISGTMCPADKFRKYNRSDDENDEIEIESAISNNCELKNISNNCELKNISNNCESKNISNNCESKNIEDNELENVRLDDIRLDDDLDLESLKSESEFEATEFEATEFEATEFEGTEFESSKLESIDKALDYFSHQGIDKVMLQIKYMGSRCNIYLFDDVEKSYAVSRNGFLIRKPEIQEGLHNIYNRLRERLSDYFKDNNLEMMIIDGELMPWSALGEEVIDSTFQAINKGIVSELDLLKNNGFEYQLSKLKVQYQGSQFDSDRCHMRKEELYDKYGPQRYESYKMLSKFYMPSIAELEKLHELYAKQLEIYAKQIHPEEFNELNYQPFSILKSVKKNGEEIHYFDSDNETLFKMVNDEEYAICDLTPDGYEKARIFFDRITKELNLEGIVIKPMKVDSGCAPYIKVRSPNYLTIIYGYDYLDKVKYDKFIEQKHIRTKLEKSISEWKLGKKLLQIPYKDISEGNSKYIDLMAKMIIETKGEVDIDPRL